MITPADFITVIKSQLLKQFPGELVYENITPTGFQRPCNLVKLVGIRMKESKPNAMNLLFTYKITDYVPVDENHISDTALLDFRTMTIVGWIFGSGYLRIGDRASQVESIQTEHNFDYTETTVVFSCAFDRNEFQPSETLPIMEQLQMRLKEASE